MVPTAIQLKLRAALKAEKPSFRPVSGGDISQAFVVSVQHATYFLKVNTAPNAYQMFEREAAGLAIIASTKTFRVPAVIDFSQTEEGSFLLLDYHTPFHRPPKFWEKFGAALADMHRNTIHRFGLDHDNFIGSLPQRNQLHPTWPQFYREERLVPQLALAEQAGKLQAADLQSFEKLFDQFDSRFPEEPSALVHGDLWSGNFLCDITGKPVLFDPAVSYSHREMDLAMARLFGGFERPFYSAYEEAWPLAPGFEQRLPAYQLYYLLVHVNLFGGGYLRSVRESLRALGV